MSAITAIALATTVAVPAFAHDDIIRRAGFDSALAATQTPSGDQGQAAAGDEDAAQVRFDAQPQSNVMTETGSLVRINPQAHD